MLVVDAMRFPYIDGTAPCRRPPRTDDAPDGIDCEHGLFGPAVPALSRRPRRPRRGGHTGRRSRRAADAGCPLRLHRADRGAAGIIRSAGDPGVYYTGSTNGNPTPYNSTNPIYHTLGIANDQAEPWDYFPFHDRDFTGVAELMLVPGCPPGLFTKQFAEFAPSRSSSGHFAQVRPQSAPPPIITPFDTAAAAFVTG